MTQEPSAKARVSLRLLGGMEVSRDARPLDLPRSRKTRALLAYLALSSRPCRRSTLCTMFWERPDDPKGALRWSLSKIRPLVRHGEDDLVITDGDFIHIDGARVSIDASDLLSAALEPDTWSTADLKRLSCAGDLLDGFKLPACTDFELWLAEKREDVRKGRLRILDVLCRRHEADAESALEFARTAADLAPNDPDVRLHLIDLLDRAGRGEEADRQRELCKTIIGTRRPAGEEPARSASDGGKRGEERETYAAGGDENVLPLPDQPSVAVLPFQKIGNAEESEIFALGLTHDVIMGLSRLRWLFVIARASAFNVLTASSDVVDIASRLGVRYITQGAVAVADGRMRVDIALIDAPTRAEIWVERFDRNVSELFAVQQEISDAIVACLQVEIETAEQRRALNRQGQTLDAWSAYHRGVWHMNKFNEDDFSRAEQLFRRTIELRPDDARAHACLSFLAFQRAFLHIDPDFEGSLDKALDLAEKSVALDPREALGHWAMGRVLLMFREYDQSVDELESAIDLNPNFAGAHFSLSRTCFAAGQSDRGISSSDIARRLSPYDPNLFAMMSVRANCLVQQGKFDEAVGWVMRAARQPNAHYHIQAIAAYCTALAGRTDLAQRYREKLLAQRPGYDLDDFLRAFPLKEAEHAELVREGLTKAGIIATA